MNDKINTPNLRIKFIQDALNLIEKKKFLLTARENDIFIEIKNRVIKDFYLTTHQYNTLMGIYAALNKKD
ncbi:MAG: hypothetical protein WCA84_16435 [Ignavibacteriaceae bacterium]